MFSRILVAALLTLLSLPAYCQTPPTNQTAAVPAYVLYDHFLFRVMWLETQANNLKTQGKNDAFIRTWIRSHAGLTDQEAATLKAIAADCHSKTSTLISTAQVLAQLASSQATVQQIQSLLNQRQQTVLEHIGQLQAAFGSTRFASLDAYVRRTVKFSPNSAIPSGFVPKPPGLAAAGK